MNSTNNLRALCFTTALILALPMAVADTPYQAPPPSPPIAGVPPSAPNPPCTVTPNGVGVNVDCNPLAAWASGQVVAWAGAYATQLGLFTADLEEWGNADVVAREFNFVGPGTSATVHVHDVMPSPYHESVVFAIKGGPAGARWTCKHVCVVPDTGFVVSLDPTDLPPGDVVDLSPVTLPTSGSLQVSFA